MNSDSALQRQGNPSLLAAQRVSLHYERIQAVWDASFEVAEHSITALVGSNGAGKTALMKGIAGILPVSQGRILFLGQPIDPVPSHRRVELGISLVPEGRRIFPYLSVKENLEIGAYTRRARHHLHHTLKEILAVFPVLESRSRQSAGSLSGGEQQMLAIGRGLMSRPRLLMLDEPSLGLAPLMVQRVFDVVQRINQEGVTLLLVEQNVRQTLKLAHMAYILETGRITLRGEGPRLLENPEVKSAFLGL